MSKELEAAELLEKAADVLEVDGWCQDALEEGTRHCAIGAMLVAASVHPWSWTERAAWEDKASTDVALASVLKAAGNPVSESDLWDLWNGVVDWNNHPDQTAVGVIGTMKQAAKDLWNEAKP